MALSRITIVTLFPEIFASFLQTALLGKALQSQKLRIDLVNPRDFAEDRHHTVDDTPYGGGGGMVLKPEPFVSALHSLDGQLHRVLLTPQGLPLNQAKLRSFSTMERHLVLVCGRYEGFDERIRDQVDEEISLGDFVLNGGEVAAMALVEGVARLIPEVIGNPSSCVTESHTEPLLEYPHYTRPRVFQDSEVPNVLVEGNHHAIDEWRRMQRLVRTHERRPDLWENYTLTEPDRALLAKHRRELLPENRAAMWHIALLHYPVHDRTGAVVTTALTNLDIHDIARSAKTYGLAHYYLVTPIENQRHLAEQIIGHWKTGGHGATAHPDRGNALSLIRIVETLEALCRDIETEHGTKPVLVGTTAKERPAQISIRELWQTTDPKKPHVLLLGTGWGLVDTILDRTDFILKPIQGPTDYNHLSVRSAAAILLDRLFGRTHGK